MGEIIPSCVNCSQKISDPKDLDLSHIPYNDISRNSSPQPRTVNSSLNSSEIWGDPDSHIPDDQLVQKTYTSRDATLYSGQMNVKVIDNQLVYLKHGKGTLEWPDGSIYTGTFRNGKFHGTGLFKNHNGDTHEGQWNRDMA